MDSSAVIRNQQLNGKRNKTEKKQPLADITKQGTEKMIELDFVSSDEEFWASYALLRTNWLGKSHEKWVWSSIVSNATTQLTLHDAVEMYISNAVLG